MAGKSKGKTTEKSSAKSDDKKAKGSSDSSSKDNKDSEASSNSKLKPATAINARHILVSEMPCPASLLSYLFPALLLPPFDLHLRPLRYYIQYIPTY